jgi:pSer/pThr/pTyr-binding forkhead associated (FHA) protein
MLVVKSGPLAGQRVDVAGELVIGRENADLVIEDPEMSRRHAIVRSQDAGLQIEDAGSLNGTWVNGERLAAPRMLSAGDTIRVGQTSIDVEAVPDRATRLASSPAPPPPGATQRAAPPPPPPTARPATPPPPQPAPTARPAPAAQAPPAAPPPAAPAAAVRAPAPAGPPPVHSPFAPPAARRRRRVATRRLTPIVFTFGAVIATAAALVWYFGQR